MKMDKTTICEKIKDLTGLQLKSLANMNLSDLEQLYEFLSDPQRVLKTLIKNSRDKFIVGMVSELENRPIVESIIKKLGGEEGVFGFGIIKKLGSDKSEGTKQQ